MKYRLKSASSFFDAPWTISSSRVKTFVEKKSK